MIMTNKMFSWFTSKFKKNIFGTAFLVFAFGIFLEDGETPFSAGSIFLCKLLNKNILQGINITVSRFYIGF